MLDQWDNSELRGRHASCLRGRTLRPCAVAKRPKPQPGDVPGPQFTAIVMGRIMLNHDMVGSKVSGNPKVRFCGELRTHFFSGDYIGHRNGKCEI